MRHISSFDPYYARRSGSTLGKVVATIASLLTIATILFVGSRDWKSDRSLVAILSDISDFRSISTKVEEAGSSTTVKNAAIAQASNEIERALIEKGTLIRRNSQLAENAIAPAGISRVTGGR